MNDEALGQFIMLVFMPYVPLLAGVVIALLLSLLIYISIRDGFVQLKESRNVQRD